MRKIVSVVLPVIVLMSACTGMEPMLKASPFNQGNIEKLRIGMLSEEVREIFGAPNEVSTSTCGAATGKPWTCETWRYEREGSRRYKTNDFTFAVESGLKFLNNWSVGR